MAYSSCGDLGGRAAARHALEAVVHSLMLVVLLGGRAAAPDALETVVQSLMVVVLLGGRAAARPYYI